MRKLVDVNYLQSEKLRAYLAQSLKNQVVFSEFVCLESFKGDSLTNIKRNLKIVSCYPSQVVVLKGGADISNINLSISGLQKRMIDYQQTKEFGKFCREILIHNRFNDEFLGRANDAKKIIDELLESHDQLIIGMTQISETYSTSDVKALRKKGLLKPQLLAALAKNIFVSTQLLINEQGCKVPEWPLVCNTFSFRYATCCQIYALLTIKFGSHPTSSPKLRNQFIDMNHAAYATFFKKKGSEKGVSPVI